MYSQRLTPLDRWCAKQPASIRFLIAATGICMMPVAALAAFIGLAMLAEATGANDPPPQTCVSTSRGNIVCGDRV
jgi:hypothetical protein